ncbi:MAG: putative baseplate assembly protein, partial [Chloroflexales bacterium]|nr:putative baseplate assembly protein [Chloroflexales bacterium]
MQYRCANERRRQAVLGHGSLNGIDYLEVLDREAPLGSPPQQTLLVRLLKPLTASLDGSNVRIEGGVRVTPVRVLWAAPATEADSLLQSGLIQPLEHAFFSGQREPEQLLLVRTDASGDYSTYRLCLVVEPDSPQARDLSLDPLLSCVDLTFKAECPNPFDCASEPRCPPERLPEPRIDYLARDYASFRRLMLDRLAQAIPAWSERSPADLGIALVELLAHAADQLSYYQDSVATEAYLGTARRRVSLRRHARLLDYAMHEGCNARAWVHLQVAAAELNLPAGALLLSRLPGLPPRITLGELPQALRRRPVVFEPLHAPLLRAAHNELRFYTWGAEECCLPKGATRATLRADGPDGPPQLEAGDVLVFEELRGPASGLAVDAD